MTELPDWCKPDKGWFLDEHGYPTRICEGKPMKYSVHAQNEWHDSRGGRPMKIKLAPPPVSNE